MTKDLYYSFIYPYLNYCCCVWGLACITYLSKLHIIQKRIARLIWGEQKYYPSHGLFKELNMLSIYDLNKCSLGMFCYKFNFELLPDMFDNFFTKAGLEIPDRPVANAMTNGEGLQLIPNTVARLAIIFFCNMICQNCLFSQYQEILKMASKS